MDIIKEGKTLGTAISRAVSALKSMQDRVHMLVVSSMWHYYEHGDSTYLTKLSAGVTKCDGVKKEKLIGYITETCGLNWDAKNVRFKKAKDSTENSEGKILSFPWIDSRPNVGTSLTMVMRFRPGS